MNKFAFKASKAVWPFVAGALLVLLQQSTAVVSFVAANFINSNLVWDSVLVLTMAGIGYMVPNKGD